MSSTGRAQRWFLFAFLLFATKVSSAQSFSTVVVFGDSLSDTGNFAHLTQANYGIRYPGASFNYADGRFTNGTATTPTANSYTGVWIEQLAAAQCSSIPAVIDSLDGGTNYAYGDATTADGTTSVTVIQGVPPIVVANMGQQVTNFLAAGALPTGNTLYVLFGGANDLFADSSTASAMAAAQREANLVQRLINAGARTFMVPNLPPVGNTPEYYGTANGPTLNAASAQFRTSLAADLQTVISAAASAGTPVQILQPDLYTQYTAIETNPSQYGLVDVSDAAQGLSLPTADTYLFWDDVHPTTMGHHLIVAAATAAMSVLNENIFIANTGGNVSSFTNTGTQLSSPTTGGGIGAAVGGCGVVWSINANGSGVSKFTDAGVFSASYTGAGINAATALSVDGAGRAWIANGNGTVSTLSSTGAAVSSTAVAAAGNISQPKSLTIDTAGSLWIANQGNNTITEVLGVAAPVVAPVVKAVSTATPAQRP